MRWPLLLNIAAAVLLLGLGIYHFSTITPTNPAWRSGTAEVTSAVLLLAAAFWLPRTVGAMVNGVLAVGLAILATYHATHAGLGSGVTEWLLALGLASAGVVMFKNRD